MIFFTNLSFYTKTKRIISRYNLTSKYMIFGNFDVKTTGEVNYCVGKCVMSCKALWNLIESNNLNEISLSKSTGLLFLMFAQSCSPWHLPFNNLIWPSLYKLGCKLFMKKLTHLRMARACNARWKSTQRTSNPLKVFSGGSGP